MKIPKTDRRVFKRHTIDNCIVRIDFEDLFDINELARDFIPILSAHFPNRRKELALKIGIINAEEKGERKFESEYVYVFADDTNKNTVNLGNTYLFLNFNNYIDFNHLSSIFDQVFKKLIEKHPNNQYRRLGLRKTNLINMEEQTGSLQNFKKYLNPFFTNHLDNNIFDDNLREDYHKMVTKYDDAELIIQFATKKGFIDEKTPVRKFILDMDCSLTDGIDEHNIIKQLEDLNKKIFNVYAWAVTEKLKEELDR